MLNNKRKQSRKKLYGEYEDSLFKLVMHDVAQKEGQLFWEEAKKLKKDPESQPSPETIQKFSHQLDAHLRKSKANTRRRRILAALNKAAVAILITLVILGTTVVTVEAVRVKALNFLMNVQQEYTSFQLQDSQLQDSSSGSENGSTIIDWHQAYAPTYIPDGYEVSAISDSKLLRAIEFKNPQGWLITYTELNAGSKPALDTENASVFETVNINGYQGTVVVKDSLTTIIWPMNDRMFMIRGEMEKDTAVKMAEGVKYID